MPTTHVNAFYADVEEKKQEVLKAQGELEAAILRLKAHPDFVEEKSDAQSQKPVEQLAPQGPQLAQKRK